MTAAGDGASHERARRMNAADQFDDHVAVAVDHIDRRPRDETTVDAAALLAYRSAWTKDVRKARVTREAAMAKMYATEAAQQVIDDAVQICGGLGVMRGHPVERLYREVRALRIYEGATEVQKIIIARDLLKQ